MARHEKMYKGSPRIEADESGKKVIKKGPSEAEKKSAEVNSGTEGVVKNAEMLHKQAEERLALFHKHEQETLAASAPAAAKKDE